MIDGKRDTCLIWLANKSIREYLTLDFHFIALFTYLFAFELARCLLVGRLNGVLRALFARAPSDSSYPLASVGLVPSGAPKSKVVVFSMWMFVG